MARFEWNTKVLLAQIDKASSVSVEQSCELLTKKIKLSMKDGDNPSAPWHAPMPDTRTLKGSISYQTSNGKFGGLEGPADSGDAVKTVGRKKNENIGVVGSDLKYSAFLESGTSKMMPRPYLRPALKLNFNKILGIVEKNGRLIIK